MRIWGIISTKKKSHSLGEGILGQWADIFLFPTHYTRFLEEFSFTERARLLCLGTQGLSPDALSAAFKALAPRPLYVPGH